MDLIGTKSKELLVKGRIFNMEREVISLPNGTDVALEIIRHPGAAAIVPFLDRDTILLLYQYRHAFSGFIWEVPAGTLNKMEPPEECARRELEEETGYRAEEIIAMGEIYPVPAYSDERIVLFLARGLKKTTQSLDSDEILTVRKVGFMEALDMVKKGEIKDSKTICSLHLAMAYRQGY